MPYEATDTYNPYAETFLNGTPYTGQPLDAQMLGLGDFTQYTPEPSNYVGTQIPNSSPSLLGGMDLSKLAALAGGLGTAGLGVAGIAQLLGGGDKQATQTLQRLLADPGALEGAAGGQALGLLGKADSLFGGQHGLMQTFDRRGPMEDQAYERGLGNLKQAQQRLETMEGALLPSIRDQLPTMLAEQQRLLSGLRPHESLEANRNAVNALVPQAMGAIPSLMQQQQDVTAPGNQFRVDPALMQALGGQALGTAQGNLPALNDNLRGQLDRVYQGRMQDVNRFVDTGLLDALERARGRGYEGGMEVFREGAPGSLLAPIMAEGVRQRGTLAGQQAEQELALAQALPLLGSRLASEQANIGFSGNAQNRDLAAILGQMMNQRLAIPQLGSGLEAQRVQTGAQAAGAYTTPISVLTQAGNNLVNLNQQLAQSLLGAGQQGIQNRIGAIGAAGGASGNASQLAAMQQQGRIAGAGQTSTTSQPTALLDAFAPTASLLGGVGGLLGGIGRYQNPNLTSGGGTY